MGIDQDLGFKEMIASREAEPLAMKWIVSENICVQRGPKWPTAPRCLSSVSSHLLQPSTPGPQEDHAVSVVDVGGDGGQPVPALGEQRLARHQLGPPQGLVDVQAAEVIIDGDGLRGGAGSRGGDKEGIRTMTADISLTDEGKKTREEVKGENKWVERRKGRARMTDARRRREEKRSEIAAEGCEYESRTQTDFCCV